LSGAVALRGLVRKELRQVRGDRRMLQILVVAPVIQLFVFAYAANLDVATTKVAVLDRDRSPESRALAARVRASDQLELVGEVGSDAEAEAWIGRGDAEIVVSVPAGYGRALASDDGETSVQLMIDGSNSVPASVGGTAVTGLVQRLARRVGEERLARLGAEAPDLPASLAVRTRVLYNPELRSRLFLVPGILGTILMLVTLIATSMAIVRERELGTLEQLVVTPVSRPVLVAGKLIPFALFGFVDSTAVLAIAHFWFKVPLEGSVVLLLASVVPFLLSTLGLGLIVSTISRTQQQAMMTAVFFVMLPMIYLSGFVFPIESMPALIQPVTLVVPLRHFLVVVRAVMLKGAGLHELAVPLLQMTALGLVIFGSAVALFRKRVD
jgi:ABC-2 type transport system permease protein